MEDGVEGGIETAAVTFRGDVARMAIPGQMDDGFRLVIFQLFAGVLGDGLFQGF